MSYNGSGTFIINTSGQPVVTGTVISSTAFNALTADLATGLSTAITKDGQTAATARIPFAQGISSTLVTDSTSTTTGSIITAGGAGIAKALFVGTTANVAGAVTLQSTLAVGGVATYSAQPIFSSLTASSAVATDASKGLVSVTNTGTGNNVLGTAPTIASANLTTALTLTGASGTAGQALTSGGSGVAPTWTTISATPGGSTNQVQYNSSGAFAGSANMTFSGTALTLANDASISGLTVGKGAGAVATNTAVGASALAANTTGATNTAVGASALAANTTASNNTAVGYQALDANTTGADNVAVGKDALGANTTASFNTAVGYQAGYTNATGISNTYIGYGSGNLATGTGNSFLGQGSGDQITSGAANTIIGRYNGNNDGLDIRTASNNIVLSDGDGNVKMHYRGSDASWKSLAIYNNTTGSAANMTVLSSGTIARSTSSLKYKRDVQDATHGLAEVLTLRPVTYKGKAASDGETVFGGLIAEEVHTAGLTEFVQYAEDGSPDALAYGNMVSLMVKAIQEQQALITQQAALITALTTRITALEQA
jgi:hypothetical protein